MNDRLQLSLELNGRPCSIWVAPDETLLDALRTRAGAVEVKRGCGEGICGTCTVLLDGELVSACTVLALQAQSRVVTTARSLAGENGGLHPLQGAFLKHGAAQCGFCTPGMLLTALKLGDSLPHAAREDIRHAITGNLCRCTGYTQIIDAIEDYLAS